MSFLLENQGHFYGNAQIYFAWGLSQGSIFKLEETFIDLQINLEKVESNFVEIYSVIGQN